MGGLEKVGRWTASTRDYGGLRATAAAYSGLSAITDQKAYTAVTCTVGGSAQAITITPRLLSIPCD